MARYVWRDGRFVDRDGAPMPVPHRDEVCCPRVQSDIPEYRSPVGDHRMITSRSERRDDLKRHGCVEIPPREGGSRGYKNPNFTAKRGLQVAEQFRPGA